AAERLGHGAVDEPREDARRDERDRASARQRRDVLAARAERREGVRGLRAGGGVALGELLARPRPRREPERRDVARAQAQLALERDHERRAAERAFGLRAAGAREREARRFGANVEREGKLGRVESELARRPDDGALDGAAELVRR